MCRADRRWGAARFGAVAALLAVAGCAAGLPAPAGAPVPDPQGYAAAIAAATTPAGPHQGVFGWTLNEAGSRLNGRGAVRYVAPERVRVDLFGPRGETYLAAAVVGEEVRLPPAAAEVALPPPAMLWAALGVLRPPADAVLESANADSTTATLRYRLPGGDLLDVRIADPATAPRIERVDRSGNRGVVETVLIDEGEAGRRRARYRNNPEFRELIIEMESLREVEGFEADVWTPGGGDE